MASLIGEIVAGGNAFIRVCEMFGASRKEALYE